MRKINNDTIINIEVCIELVEFVIFVESYVERK
jgi:hypothetical protein